MASAVERAIDEIAAHSRIPLESCKVAWGGSDFDGFRPVGVGDREAFSIALTRSVFRAQAAFVVDRFAGAMLRRIGLHTADELQWAEISLEGEERGISTHVTVDDESVSDLAQLEPQLWHSLEIECTMRRPSHAPADDVTDLVAVGVQCLTMILAGLDLDDDQVDPGMPEGAASRVEVTRYERSRVNRMRCIREYGTACWVCDFAFSRVYGSIGEDFIEVHHRVPVSTLPPDYRVDPIRDLIPLCSNCHSMVHRRTPVYQPDELRRLLGKPAKQLPLPTIPLD